MTTLDESPAEATMWAVQVDGLRRASLGDKPTPRIRREYVRLKVVVAPMCNEYLAYQDGLYLERNRPDSLGHEMAGEVVEAPESAMVKVGDRVVALCGYPCGRCELCLMGYYSHCASTEDPRSVCDSESGESGFAQYAVKPDWMLLPIPAGMSYEHASMACCGLGPTFGVMQRLNVAAGDTVLITGLGAVGLGGVINARFRGAEVIAVGRSGYRVELARRLGCREVLDPGRDDVVAAVHALTGGRGVDFAIDCSGQADYQRYAIDSVKRLGAAAFLAEPGVLQVDVERDLVARGVTLMGSLDMNRADGDRMLRMIARIPEQLDAYITHRLPMSAIGEAFELQIARECGKIILYPWES